MTIKALKQVVSEVYLKGHKHVEWCICTWSHGLLHLQVELQNLGKLMDQRDGVCLTLLVYFNQCFR